MWEAAQISGYEMGPGGTALALYIPGRYLMEQIEAQHIRRAEVRLDDGRRISAEQRKKAYATIRDISDWTGDVPEAAKEWLKYLYIGRTGADYFSLGTCSVEEARHFISFLLDFALEEGVPLTDAGIDRADDIGAYLYSCLRRRKCAVCGRDGEVHHWDAIGMGRDRRKVDDSGHRKICLCRVHHTEAHTIGREAFEDKYHVYGIIDAGKESA